MNFQYKVSEIVGTIFFVGKLPYAPGTWGSLAALLTWYKLKPYLEDPVFLFITGFIFFLGIIVSDIIIEKLSEKDPKEIVIDEWVGMWIALYLVPHQISWGFIAFLLFRIFDIFKPGPIQDMDDMEGSIGLMLDDVVAGILACMVTQSLIYLST